MPSLRLSAEKKKKKKGSPRTALFTQRRKKKKEWKNKHHKGGGKKVHLHLSQKKKKRGEGGTFTPLFYLGGREKEGDRCKTFAKGEDKWPYFHILRGGKKKKKRKKRDFFARAHRHKGRPEKEGTNLPIVSESPGLLVSHDVGRGKKKGGRGKGKKKGLWPTSHLVHEKKKKNGEARLSEREKGWGSSERTYPKEERKEGKKKKGRMGKKNLGGEFP